MPLAQASYTVLCGARRAYANQETPLRLKTNYSKSLIAQVSGLNPRALR